MNPIMVPFPSATSDGGTVWVNINQITHVEWNAGSNDTSLIHFAGTNKYAYVRTTPDQVKDAIDEAVKAHLIWEKGL